MSCRASADPDELSQLIARSIAEEAAAKLVPPPRLERRKQFESPPRPERGCATKKYLLKQRWNLSSAEHHAVSNGEVPDSMPAYMVCRDAEFVRERIYPHHAQVLHDYRVHYFDGTYDLISITPAQEPPEAGKFYSRAAARAGGDFVTWEETGDESDGALTGFTL